MKRIRTLALAALLLLCTALPAWAAPNVSMAVRGANEGRAKPNAWTTVLVELTNQGGEMTGELQVRPTVPDGAGGGFERFPEYIIPVSLPAGGKKKVPVEVPMQHWNKVRVTLRSEGVKVAEEDLTLTMLPGDAALIGVLSGDELGVPALNRVGQNTHVVRLDADTLPSRAALLEHYDVLAISRFDTGTLSKEQMKALETWVGKGGTLLLAGGPEWKRSFTGLPASLLPVEVTGVASVDLAPLGAAVEKPLSGSGPVSQGRLVSGQALVRSGETILLAQNRVGAGRVVYMAADPGLEPLAAWQGQGDLYARYLASARGARMDFGGDTDSMMGGALQRIPGMGLPSVGTVALILLGYLLMVGPLNYVLLKRFDKREWAWLSVPLVSVLFVGGVYGLSVGRRTPLLSHVITVTELTPGADAGTMKTYVGLYAPSRNNLTVALGDARLVKPITYGGAGPGPTGRVRAGEKTTVELLGFNNYSMKGFAMEQDVATPGLALADISYTDGKITGSVVNRLGQPVTGLRVFMNQTAITVGDLAPGQKSPPFELLFSGAATNPKMRGMMFDDSGGPMNDERIRRDQIWNATFGWGQRSATPGTITVAGWTQEPVGPLALPDLGRVIQGGNMIWAELPIPIDGASADIPPGLITAVPTGGQVIRAPMGWQMQPGTYTFSLQLPQLDPAKVAEVTLHAAAYGSQVGMPGNLATMSALNRKTGAWVPLTDEAAQALKDWPDFVGKDGLLEIRMETRAHFEMPPLTVSVKGVGR